MNTITQPTTEFQQLALYLYENLIKDFKRFYRAQTVGTDDAKAISIILSYLNKMSPSAQQDMMGGFVAYKLPVVIAATNLSLSSYQLNQSTVMNAFKNMLIDVYRKNKTEDKHVIQCHDVRENDTEDNMINIIETVPDTTDAYDNTIDLIWEHWAGFVKTLSSKDKALSMYFLPVGSHSSVKLAKELGMSERTVRHQANKLRELFVAYLAEQGVVR